MSGNCGAVGEVKRLGLGLTACVASVENRDTATERAYDCLGRELPPTIGFMGPEMSTVILWGLVEKAVFVARLTVFVGLVTLAGSVKRSAG